MKVIYVAGPYRGPSEYAVVQNIRRAEALAIEVWRLGAACICPHKNTALFGGACPDKVWLDGDLEILLRCDGVLLCDDWHTSSGAKAECQLAHDNGIPVFRSLDELKHWLEKQEAP